MSEKITAMIEEIKGLTVLELKELIDAYCEEFGVSAVAAVAPAAAGAAAAAFRRIPPQGAVRDAARCADDCADCPAGAAAHARARRGAAVPARERLHDDD